MERNVCAIHLNIQSVDHCFEYFLNLVFRYVFSVFIILVFISTSYELCVRLFLKDQDKKQNNSLIQSFSAINNFREVFWADRPNKKLRMFDGLRAILAFVVLLCHEHELAFLPFQSKGTAFLNRLLYTRNYFLIKNVALVDNFFFLGGD